jgi:hypothetical protein
MPTANSIITPQTALSKAAVCTTAETSFHSPTNVQTLIDDASDNPSSSNGMRLTSLYAIARAAVATACNCQLYRKVGTTYTLIDSVLMSTGTPGAAVANQKADFGYSEDAPMLLEPGTGLAVAIGQSIANGVTFRTQGGKY